jgi:phage shock protein PspC (stress-responsive transcriptional regulator)
MNRSFSDRIWGGVCGGIAERLPLNAWVWRAVFVVLTPLTLGSAAVLYLMLWLALPQASPVTQHRGDMRGLLLALILTALVFGGWAARLYGVTLVNGSDLYFPLLLLLVALVFFIKQLGRTTA